MSNKDLNEKNVERICQDEITRRMLYKVIGQLPAELMRPLRPHTWIFMRQRNNRKEPVICLGIVFNTWDRSKFNMLRFTANRPDGTPVTTSGRFTVLDNGERGLVIDVRWAWNTLLKKYRGLSAGNL